MVIDPDSEYRHVMNAIGGRHFEVGRTHSTRLRLPVMWRRPASLLLPVLSVMGGD